jgi:hypothetical protein
VTYVSLRASVGPALFVLAWTLFAIGAGGCASVAGLDQYAGGSSSDASVPMPAPTSLSFDASATDRAEPPVGRGGDDGSRDALAPADDAQDGPASAGDAGATDAGGGDAQGTSGTDARSDAPVEQIPDASPPPDASDARPQCSRSTCGGCCTAAGDCVGGQSATTCGTGGALCADCTMSGQSCNAGVCSSVAHDAGACTMLSCTTLSNLCIPVWQQPCCKMDGTCGCYITIPIGPCR